MVDRRHLLVGSFCAVLAARADAASPPPQETTDIDQLGKFELVLGRPGVVVGVPHGTPDIGTVEVGQILRERLGAGGVIVTGFWDAKTRQRVNVNRPTEQLIGPDSQVLREWPSDRAAAANARYIALVKEAAQGRLKVFYEIHSNHKPLLANSIEVSTLGVSRGEAARLRAAFEAARHRLAPEVPQLAIHVSPLDKVTYPNYHNASSISGLSERGCAIESPGHVLGNRAWRLAVGACLADAIKEAQW
jgi:hypothetical protein